MGLGRAIAICLLKSLVFFGRASRSEYLGYLPVGVLLPLVTYLLLRSGDEPLPAAEAVGWCCLAIVPLAAVTRRRLNDTGEDSDLFGPPAGALVLFAIMWPLHSTYWAWLSNILDHGDGPWMLFVVLVLVPIAALSFAVTLGAFLFGLFAGASLFGHMLLPSRPDTAGHRQQ